MCSDPLCVAAACAAVFFATHDLRPGWGELVLARLLTGDGWVVSYSKHLLVFDKELEP